MGRLASALILGSQLLLVLVALAPSGTTAIWFSFVGTPLLVLGCVLGIVALSRRPRTADLSRSGSSGTASSRG